MLVERISSRVHRSQYSCRTPSYPKSLNRDARRKQMVDIAAANQALNKRLQEAQPVYHVNKWEKDMQKREKVLKLICEYPYELNAEKSVPRRRSTLDRTRRKKRGQRLSPLGSRLVFSKDLTIAGRVFIVEIYSLGHGVSIQAYDRGSFDSFSLDLGSEQVANLIGPSHNYFKLASLLGMDNDKLALIERPQEYSKDYYDPFAISS